MVKIPESKILKDSKSLLNKLEIGGLISHWTRINVGMFYTTWGGKIKIGKEFEPDLWVFVPVDKKMWVMFFEIKNSEGGIRGDGQIKFQEKFKGFDNVICDFITDPKQIKEHIKQARSLSTDMSCFKELDEKISNF